MLPARLQFLFHIPAVMNLGSKQDLTISRTRYPGHRAAFIDAKRYFLDVSLTLPAKLDGKGTVPHDFCPASTQEFARLCGSAGHEWCAILVANIDFDRHGFKLSFWSKMLLATVD